MTDRQNAASRIGEPSDAVKILGETAGGYIVDADGWSFESCPGCGTLVGEWLSSENEDGRDVMLLVECPMCIEASRDEEWWF